MRESTSHSSTEQRSRSGAHHCVVEGQRGEGEGQLQPQAELSEQASELGESAR